MTEKVIFFNMINGHVVINTEINRMVRVASKADILELPRMSDREFMELGMRKTIDNITKLRGHAP